MPPFHHSFFGSLAGDVAVPDAPVVARTASDDDDDGFDCVLTLDPAPADGVLLLAVETNDDNNYNPPAGWSTVASTGNKVHYKIASSEGTTFTFVDVGGNKGDDGGPVAMVEITGADGTSPIEDTDISSGTATTPAGTTLGPNRLAVTLALGGSALTTLTNSWTVNVSAGNGPYVGIGSKEIASTGSTGTSDWSNTATTVTTLVIKP